MAIVNDGGVDYPALLHRVRQDADGVNYLVEISEDLELWQSGDTFTTQVGDSQDNSDGTVTLTIRSLQPLSTSPSQYLRLRVSLIP